MFIHSSPEIQLSHVYFHREGASLCTCVRIPLGLTQRSGLSEQKPRTISTLPDKSLLKTVGIILQSTWFPHPVIIGKIFTCLAGVLWASFWFYFVSQIIATVKSFSSICLLVGHSRFFPSELLVHIFACFSFGLVVYFLLVWISSSWTFCKHTLWLICIADIILQSVTFFPVYLWCLLFLYMF